MNDEPAGRHAADGSGGSWGTLWRAVVGSFAVRRTSLAVAYLACAAVAGGIGYVIAPLIGQPRDAGFWGGVTITFGLILVASTVCVIGYERGSQRFRWMERVYAYMS